MTLPTLSDLISDLQLAKELAIQSGNANSLVTATLAQAKLLGLDKPVKEPAQQLDINVSYVTPLPENLAELSASELSKLYFEMMQ